jgi:nitrite reductase/ring-hydroxylating ferredoxin subunit
MTSETPHHWFDVPHAPAPGTLLGTRDALTDGQAVLHNVGEFKLLLLRSGQEVTAYVNRCAHFGVPLAARQEHLIYTAHASITCNVHYAKYRWSDGLCTAGDCEGESLLPIPLEMDAQGHIRIANGIPAP